MLRTRGFIRPRARAWAAPERSPTEPGTIPPPSSRPRGRAPRARTVSIRAASWDARDPIGTGTGIGATTIIGTGIGAIGTTTVGSFTIHGRIGGDTATT